MHGSRQSARTNHRPSLPAAPAAAATSPSPLQHPPWKPWKLNSKEKKGPDNAADLEAKNGNICHLSVIHLSSVCVQSPTLSPTDPVSRGLLTLCPWASSGPQGLYTAYIQCSASTPKPRLIRAY